MSSVHTDSLPFSTDREVVEETLAAAVEEFNATQDAQERVRLISLIRRLRGQLGAEEQRDSLAQQPPGSGCGEAAQVHSEAALP